MVDVTCWTLIDGAADGDVAARNEFAARYQPVVTSYLKARWRDRIHALDIDDAAQEVFVECFKPRGVLDRARTDRERNFRPFLYGVVRNVAQRFESRAANRTATPSSESFAADAHALDEPSLTRVFDRAWAQSLLREAVERHERAASIAGADHLRRVEILREVFRDGRSIAELARRWSVDEDALRREYDRARQEFRRALTEVVAFHNPDRPEVVARECRELAAYFAE